MTPPVPQHCAHECVCGYFHKESAIAHRDGTPCMRNHEGCKSCVFDSRKSAAIAEHDNLITQINFGDFDNNATKWLEDHDERVRKEERERVLVELMFYLDGWRPTKRLLLIYTKIQELRRGEHQ